MDERSALIGSDDLDRLMRAPGAHVDLKILDASWRMPGAAPAIADFERRRIPGATFFDIDAIADRTSGLPHMLPSQAAFEAAAGALGLTRTHAIVVYDDAGIFSAPRVWWMFRAMGHNDVRVLDGGLPKWLREGRLIETDPPQAPTPAAYAAQPREIVRTAADVRVALATGGVVLDARPAARFSGEAPEPRPGLRSGAMPGARNIPYTDLLTPDGVMRPPAELERIFAAAAADTGAVIATCGSGVTAAVILLALARIGRGDHGLYDGSWAEWGREDADTALFPVASGRAH